MQKPSIKYIFLRIKMQVIVNWYIEA